MNKVCPDKGGASGKGRGGHVLINHDIMNKEFVTVKREGMGWWCLNWGGGVLEDVMYSLIMISWISYDLINHDLMNEEDMNSDRREMEGTGNDMFKSVGEGVCHVLMNSWIIHTFFSG